MNDKAGCGSVGIAGTLTIVYIVLKLCGVIAWTWVLITAIRWVFVLIVALLA